MPRAAHQNGFAALRAAGALFDGGTRSAGSDAGGFRPAAASVARYQARVNCVTKAEEGNMSAESKGAMRLHYITLHRNELCKSNGTSFVPVRDKAR